MVKIWPYCKFCCLLIFLWMAVGTGFSQKNNSPKSPKPKSTIQLAWTGVFSSFFDSLSCDMLNRQIWEQLSKSEDFSPRRDFEKNFELNNVFQRTKNPLDMLGENLKSGDLPLFFVTMEKKSGHFEAKSYIKKPHSNNIQLVDSLWFEPAIQTRIRQAAPHILNSLKKHFSLILPQPPQNPVFQFNQPLVGGMLTQDGLILKQDSVTRIYSGQTLVTRADFVSYPVQTEKFSHILFPSSSYTFHSPSLMEINSGEMGIIQLEFPLTLVSPSLKLQIKKAILKLSHRGNKTFLYVFAGEIQAQSILSEDKKNIGAKTQAESFGQITQTKNITDSAFIELLDPFKKQLTPHVFSYFKSSKRIMEIAPNQILDYYYPDVSDPMEYFMAEEFRNLGVDMEALEFEGESWKTNTNLIRQGIDETGCYLCAPGNVMAP